MGEWSQEGWMGEVRSTLFGTANEHEMVLQRNENWRYLLRDVGVGERMCCIVCLRGFNGVAWCRLAQDWNSSRAL